ncbi:hypothetical protein BKA93DRAFT_221704 [Sparassis latifolia]
MALLTMMNSDILQLIVKLLSPDDGVQLSMVSRNIYTAALPRALSDIRLDHPISSIHRFISHMSTSSAT